MSILRLNRERLRSLAKSFPRAHGCWRALRRIANADARAVARLQQSAPEFLCQPFSTTLNDRYPEFFDWLCNRLCSEPKLRILSYGCSTGEEVFSLLHYFPNAEFVGIDVNPRNIEICNRRLKDRGLHDRIRFVCAESPEDETTDSFDIVFCMAVLRHGTLQAEVPKRCDPLLDFAIVERLVADLARCVKRNGYLAIWHAHFRFCDMRSSEGFAVVLRQERNPEANFPLYGPDNCLLECEPYCDVIFKKVEPKRIAA